MAIKQGFPINSNNGKDISSKVMVAIFSLLAELERDLISERTKVALSRAKASGKKLGRPKRAGKSRLDGKAEIKNLMEKGVTRANIARILGVSWGLTKAKRSPQSRRDHGAKCKLPCSALSAPSAVSTADFYTYARNSGTHFVFTLFALPFLRVLSMSRPRPISAVDSGGRRGGCGRRGDDRRGL